MPKVLALGPRTLDVSLTLGRLQTKEEKSTNQWSFSPTEGGERKRRGGGWEWLGWARSASGYEGDAWRLGLC